jgi:hypothetical protein
VFEGQGGKMSYLVLALGVLLSLCGAIAVSTSYGIIQVERGWAGVIAGTTALSCGIVTIALGCILHGLSRLRALVKTGTGLAPLPPELGEDEASELRPELGLAFNRETSMVSEAGPPLGAMPPASSLRTWPQRQTRPSLIPARNFLKAHGTVAPAARGTPESDFAVSKSPFAGTKVSPAAMEAPSEPGFAIAGDAAPAKSEDEAKTRPASPPAAEAPTGPAWYSGSEQGLLDDDKAKEPSTEAQPQETHIDPGKPETESGPRVTRPAETASIDATFGDDRLIAPEAVEPASTAPPFVSEALSAADSREPSPPAGEAGLVIVGRYESEGTSYVMYADGSIEARSERGVFHFQSMAELKAFMEAQT